MSPPVAPWELAFRLVFVLYCTTVGLILLYAPWTASWGSFASFLPAAWSWLGDAWVRGAISGFGLVHLVWVLNEFDEVLRMQARPDGDDEGVGAERETPVSPRLRS